MMRISSPVALGVGLAGFFLIAGAPPKNKNDKPPAPTSLSSFDPIPGAARLHDTAQVGERLEQHPRRERLNEADRLTTQTNRREGITVTDNATSFRIESPTGTTAELLPADPRAMNNLVPTKHAPIPPENGANKHSAEPGFTNGVPDVLSTPDRR